MDNPTIARLLLRRERLKTVIMHEPQDGLPTIAPFVAQFISVAFAVAYVVPFYYSKALRVSRKVSRNSPDSIRARSHAVFLVCLLCFAITVNIHSVTGPATPSEILHRMGLAPVSFTDTLKSLLLIVILFAGPLFELGIVEDHWRHWFRWRTVRADIWDDWIGWRNLVVGPLSEEFLFRSINISLFLAAWVRGPTIIIQAPLVFGVAHLHHLNEFIIMHKPDGKSYLSALVTPSIILPGLIQSLFQFAFTTLFGMLVTFIFLRTGNVYSCILIHAFCNWMGFPRLWGRLGEAVTVSPESVRSDELEMDNLNPRQDDIPLASSTAKTWSLGIQWTIAYYSLIILGVVGLYNLLYPLTASSNALTYV